MLSRNFPPSATGGLNSLQLFAALRQSGLIPSRLLQDGIDRDIDAKDHQHKTPLFLAAKNGCDNLVDLLLLANANPNIPDASGKSPIHCAVESGSLGVLQALLKKGVDARVVDPEGYTPLALSIKLRFVEAIDLLLLHGVEVKDIAGPEGQSALHVAARYGNSAVAVMLLGKGADATKTCDSNATASKKAHLQGNTALGNLLEGLEDGQPHRHVRRWLWSHPH